MGGRKTGSLFLEPEASSTSIFRVIYVACDRAGSMVFQDQSEGRNW